MLLALFLFLSGPSEEQATPWLGSYRAGPEIIAFRWDDGLVYHHGNMPIPVDGEWHITVPEFAVRHRATWLAETGTIRLDESHDDSQPWSHELRLAGVELTKVSLTGGRDGGEIVVRRFAKQIEE